MIWMKKDQYSEADLAKKIEELRGQLVVLAGEKGFGNEEVIQLSQHLDKYIVQVQNKMNTKTM
ncbi:aspartyl-phosphate phosphatase Spo0E family protein [Brevibacillus sp. NPDC003440]